MSQHSYAPYSHDLMARGRVLAEGRMTFLQELYDSGRWRRYHGEQEFLSMVRETRVALGKWCAVAPPSETEIAASPILFAAMRAPTIVPDDAPVAEEDAPVDLTIDDALIDMMAMALAEDEPMPSPVDLDELAAAAA
jgi:uncharacterized repeat protein (TIGR03809 family)